MITQPRLSRILCFAGAILTFGGGAIALTETSVSAHTPVVTPSCTGLAITLTAYEGPATNNRATTTINGVATVADFGVSYSQTFAWSPTTSNTWSVVIDANRGGVGNATAYDATFSGTWVACQAPTTVAPTTVAPTTVAPTTVAPTTVAPTTVAPSTTQVLSDSPTTTLGSVAAPTTIQVASGGPVPPTTVGPTGGPAVRQLPATGNASGSIVILGVAMFGLGLILMAVRRSRPVSG